MASEQLVALAQRLQSLPYTSNHQGSHVEPESLTVESSQGKYICGECALTFSTVYGLRQHFTKQHIRVQDRPHVCQQDGCGRRFLTEASLKAHLSRGFHYLHCGHAGRQSTFNDGAHLSQHEKQHWQRDSDFHTRTCPHPGCGKIFADQASLFAHYNGLHPLSILQPGIKNPFKCPFCPKRYNLERYMPSHQRRDHSTNQGSSDNDSQEALIRQSQESMARKASQAPHESDTELDYASQEDDESLHQTDDHEFSLDGDTVYIRNIKDEPVPSSPYERENQAQPGSMAIGYLLASQHIDHEGPHVASHEDEYPESFALDEDELPRSNDKIPVPMTDAFHHELHGQRIIRWMLILLKLEGWLGVSEVLDVWDTLLTPDQRMSVLQQLQSIDVGNEDSVILSALHESVLCEVIHAWARFKLLTFQIPAEMKQHMSSAKDTALAILRYCQAFEKLIDEARVVASARRLELPDLLRRAPADDSVINPSASFANLLSALESRVKCRMMHSDWLQLTNEMVLKEMVRYIQDLKTEAKATYPLALRTDSWYRNMGVS